MLVLDRAGPEAMGVVDEPLLHGSVHDNVDNVADLVLAEVCRQGDHTLLLEVARECIASACAETGCVTHLEDMLLVTVCERFRMRLLIERG